MIALTMEQNYNNTRMKIEHFNKLSEKSIFGE